MIKTKVELWQDSLYRPRIVNIVKQREKGILGQSTIEDAKGLAALLMNCARGDSLELLLKHIIKAIQYNHLDYDEGDLLQRALSAISDIESRVE